jgi:hypothetical protein
MKILKAEKREESVSGSNGWPPANIWRISQRRRRNGSIINGRGNDENVRQKVMAGGVVEKHSVMKISAKSVIQLTVMAHLI